MHAEHADSAWLDDLSGRVVGCVFTVLNTLGVGFPEKAYENTLAQELRDAGLAVEQQHRVKVHYHGVVVGDYSTGLPLCLLLNFGKSRLEIKRVVRGP
jgi:PD-(D/E)XK nuclease superfamily